MTILRKLKIRQKLTMLLLFIGIVPTLLLSAIAYVNIRNQLASTNEQQLSDLAAKQSQKINTLLQGRQEEVSQLANLYNLQTAISAYYASGAKDPQTIAAVLRERKADMPGVQAIYLSDTAKAVIASTVSGQKEQKLDINFATKAGQQNSIAVGVDPQDNTEKLYVATLVNVNQKAIGTLTLVFGLDDIVATVHDYTGLGETGETVLARADRGHEISIFPLRFNEQGNVNLDNLQLSGNLGHTYSAVRDYRGQEVLVSAQPIAPADWILATKLDRAEAFAPIDQLRNTLLIVVLGSSAVIIAIALVFTRFFTGPIITLTEKTRNVILGNFNQRIDVKSEDEVGVLAVTFNAMTEKLAKSYQALERKVEERTQALNQKVQELEDAKAKDEAILGSVGEGMIVTDSSGKVLLINELAATLLNVDFNSAVGNMFKVQLLYGDSDAIVPEQEQPMRVALATGKKTTQQVKSVSPDGKKRVLGITATPVAQQGKVIGSIQILRDITREKEIDRMKTEFISLASHQLRTPLSAIRWFAEMLISGDVGKLNPEQEEMAQNVYSSTERMIELVGSLLNISRIESGRIRIDPEPTDVRQLVNGIVNDLKGKTEERQQTIIVSVHDELPKIKLDPRLIGQVYLNLLTNAIKYSPKGGEISVFVSRRGEELVSQVTDSGYGIPAAEQPKMFQKFFRATNISKVETDGTGLGMYLVKSIIESSGGKIWFKSEEGKGTTFWFSLPMSGMKAKEGEVTID